MDSAVWLVIAVVLAVVEASTAQLVCIWFALGAICSMITAMITDSVWVQVVVFVFSTAVFLVLTRKIVRRLTDAKASKTNAEALIGREFIIQEEVDNDKETGTVKASGIVWSVRNSVEGVIPSGTRVIIEKIEGVKLLCKKVD